MRRYLSVSVIMLTGLAVWLTFGEGSTLATLDTLTPVTPNTADNGAVYRQSYLEGALLRRYNEDGQREQTLGLAAADQYTNSETQYLKELRFEGSDTDGKVWIMTSKTGELRNGGSELLLAGDVRITDSRTQSVLDTTNLTIYPDQKIASNEAPLTLTSTTSQTHAEGLVVDFEKGTATLKRKVETVYEP